jgi:hypothetical protein
MSRSKVCTYELVHTQAHRLYEALPAVAPATDDSCPQPSSEIATDRPDTTNPSLVVPQGRFQQENGVL